ncbi:MAG: hypothetical protein ACK4Z3_01040 [Rhizobium rosettiformans]
MPHALIENGLVSQLWLPDDPPEGYVEVPEYVQPGYLFDGTSFTPPEAPSLPTPPLPRLTFWLAAAEIGVTKAGIRAHIDAMPEGVEKFQALAYLEEAQVYRRNDPLLIQMAAVEGITEPELDALWAWAAQAYP